MTQQRPAFLTIWRKSHPRPGAGQGCCWHRAQGHKMLAANRRNFGVLRLCKVASQAPASTGLGTPSSHAQQFDYRGSAGFSLAHIRCSHDSAVPRTWPQSSSDLQGCSATRFSCCCPDWMRPPECAHWSVGFCTPRMPGHCTPSIELFVRASHCGSRGGWSPVRRPHQ
jgi:hypothetical protein